MKSFKFRLQTVLEQRRRQEMLAKQGLATAEAAHARAMQLLAELLEVQSALLSELSSRRSEAFDAVETRTYQEYLQTIGQSIRDQETYIDGIALERDSRRHETVKAAQARQALDRIKDHDKHSFGAMALRLEQNITDEIAMGRFNKNRREGEKG